MDFNNEEGNGYGWDPRDWISSSTVPLTSSTLFTDDETLWGMSLLNQHLPQKFLHWDISQLPHGDKADGATAAQFKIVKQLEFESEYTFVLGIMCV